MHEMAILMIRQYTDPPGKRVIASLHKSISRRQVCVLHANIHVPVHAQKSHADQHVLERALQLATQI